MIKKNIFLTFFCVFVPLTQCDIIKLGVFLPLAGRNPSNVAFPVSAFSLFSLNAIRLGLETFGKLLNTNTFKLQI